MIAEPGTPEWEAARLGKLTASRLYDALGTTQKGTWLASRREYMIELAAERMTGMRSDPYLSGPMLWGVESEPLAIAAYEKARGITTEKIGFVVHPLLKMCGATPDALVSDDGILEIKCPESATHIATLVEREIPEKYLMQMHWQMACLPARRWCDYMSFDPRMPPRFRSAVIRVERDQKRIARLTLGAEDFLNDLERIVAGIETGQPYVPEDWKPRTAPAIAKPEHLASEDAARDLKPTNLFPRKR